MLSTSQLSHIQRLDFQNWTAWPYTLASACSFPIIYTYKYKACHASPARALLDPFDVKCIRCTHITYISSCEHAGHMCEPLCVYKCQPGKILLYVYIHNLGDCYWVLGFLLMGTGCSSSGASCLAGRYRIKEAPAWIFLKFRTNAKQHGSLGFKL